MSYNSHVVRKIEFGIYIYSILYQSINSSIHRPTIPTEGQSLFRDLVGGCYGCSYVGVYRRSKSAKRMKQVKSIFGRVKPQTPFMLVLQTGHTPRRGPQTRRHRICSRFGVNRCWGDSPLLDLLSVFLFTFVGLPLGAGGDRDCGCALGRFWRSRHGNTRYLGRVRRRNAWYTARDKWRVAHDAGRYRR